MNPSRSIPLLLVFLFALGSISDLSAQALFVPGGSTNGIGTSSNGNVGIGTMTPSEKLSILGDIKLGDASNSRGHSVTQNYMSLGETESAATTILGNNIKVVDGVNNRLQVSTSSDDGSNWFAINYYSGFTFNHVAAASVGSQFDENNGELMRIAINGNVGIGTTAPSEKLNIRGNLKLGDGSDSRGHSLMQSYMSLGETENAATTILGNNVNVVNGVNNRLQVSTSGDDGSNWITINYYNGFTFNHVAPTAVGSQFDENSGELMRIATNGNVGIGTTNATHKLAVNGTVRAKEVIVDTGWADYVFADDYELKPLAEVEAHIREKKHLPGIPSAAEVAEHGVSIGEMQAKLLAKIEELMLHAIAQEKRYAEQERRLAAQEERLQKLEAENQALRGH